MRRLALTAALTGLMLIPFCGVSRAQDVRPLLDRMDRLERDINQLQRQVYRPGSAAGAPVPMAPVDSSAALNAEVRFGQIDDQMRSLRGQLEEANNGISQLRTRLEKLVNDVDLRLSALERPGDAPKEQAANVPPPPRGAGNTTASVPPPPRGASDPTAPASQSGNLGTLSTTGSGAPTPAAARGPGANVPAGTAEEQYDYAIGLLRSSKYPDAEQALRSFIQKNPAHPMTANAQYWLGETFYVRSDFKDAAATFAEGYQKFPKSGKGPDYLLKLGMSLGRMGQKADACKAYQRLDRDFPIVPQNIKDVSTGEKQKLAC